MENEPKPFDPSEIKEETDGTLSPDNTLAREKLKEELKEAGLAENFPDLKDPWEEAA